MVNRDLFTIHGVRDNDILHFADRDTAGVLRVPRRNRLLLRCSGISRLEQDLAGVRVDSSAFQQRFEGDPCPLRRAHGTQLPLSAFYLRHQKDSSVPGAFQSRRFRDRRHRQQFLIADGEGAINRATDRQLVLVPVKHGSLVMTTNVEEVVRRKELFKLIEGIFQIDWIAFTDDEADLGFAGCHRGAHNL